MQVCSRDAALHLSVDISPPIHHTFITPTNPSQFDHIVQCPVPPSSCFCVNGPPICRFSCVLVFCCYCTLFSESNCKGSEGPGPGEAPTSPSPSPQLRDERESSNIWLWPRAKYSLFCASYGDRMKCLCRSIEGQYINKYRKLDKYEGLDVERSEGNTVCWCSGSSSCRGICTQKKQNKNEYEASIIEVEMIKCLIGWCKWQLIRGWRCITVSRSSRTWWNCLQEPSE